MKKTLMTLLSFNLILPMWDPLFWNYSSFPVLSKNFLEEFEKGKADTISKDFVYAWNNQADNKIRKKILGDQAQQKESTREIQEAWEKQEEEDKLLEALPEWAVLDSAASLSSSSYGLLNLEELLKEKSTKPAQKKNKIEQESLKMMGPSLDPLTKRFKCSFEDCLKSYVRKCHAQEHIKTIHYNKRVKCPSCAKSFTSSSLCNHKRLCQKIKDREPD